MGFEITDYDNKSTGQVIPKLQNAVHFFRYISLG
jgi:hypothetical protein